MIGDLAKNIAGTSTFEYASTESYPRFEALMDKFGYEWEAIKVTTEDDYILSTFHVLGKKGSERNTSS